MATKKGVIDTHQFGKTPQERAEGLEKMLESSEKEAERDRERRSEDVWDTTRKDVERHFVKGTKYFFFNKGR